jgi:acyl carrier protein
MNSTSKCFDRMVVARCVMECGRELLKIEQPITTVDLNGDLIEGEDLLFGGHALDSLGFVQWMAEIEAELEVSVMGSIDIEEGSTLGDLVDMIIAEAPGEQLAEFCDRWGPSSDAGR